MFIIIPIEHEASWVRRLPIITIGIIAINFLVYSYVAVTGWDKPGIDIKSIQRLESAMASLPCAEIPDSWWNELQKKYPEKTPYIQVLKRVFTQDELLREARSGVCANYTREVFQQHTAAAQKEIMKVLESIKTTVFDTLGFHPQNPKLYEWITSLFVHAGFLHLFFNMLFFWIVGYALEDKWGRLLFTLVYFAGGIVATFAYLILTGQKHTVLVGVSGAVASLMGAFAVRFGRVKMHLYVVGFAIFRVFSFSFWARAWIILMIWFIREVWNFTMYKNASVAFSAHIGGFIFGFVLALVFRMLQIEEKFINPRIEEKLVLEETHPVIQKAGELLTNGEVKKAYDILRPYLATHNDFDGWLLMLDIVEKMGDRILLGETLVKCFDLHIESKDDDLISSFLPRFLEEASNAYIIMEPRQFKWLYTYLHKQGKLKEFYTFLEHCQNAVKDLPLSLLLQWVDWYIKMGEFKKAYTILDQSRNRWESDPYISSQVEDSLNHIKQFL